MTPPLVLASASPRRSDILAMLGVEHEVVPADIPEEALPDETPESHVERLSREKAEAVARRRPGELVLAGDTVVVVGGRILGKPGDAAEAVAMLKSLAGRTHRVATGLALAVPATDGGAASPSRLLSRVDVAEVRFRAFDDGLAEAYVATGEPMDKAGAYGIQGLGAALVDRVEGDYYAVVGLPVSGLLALLAEAGRPWSFPSRHSHPP